MKLNSLFVLISAMTLGCQTIATRTSARPLNIKTFTSNEAGFLVNSHLIEGQSEAILVDAQFTRSQARKVIEMVKASRKNLNTIYITHGHPDHYFGLELLVKEFPKAKVIASRGVIADIKATAQGKLDYWKKMYGEDLADSYVTPEPFDGTSLVLEGNEIQLVELAPGESESATVLYIPSLQALITGDMAYNQVHLWLAENRPESWLKNLQAVTGLGRIKNVLTGHGEPAGAELLESNRKYILDFVEITERSQSKKAALAEINRRYPSFRLPIIAELSVGARMK
jgi:glyoxylase-like metal-dependent hydrolase (beta-lactamase superfamily II)